jgi:hypothetical protein
VETKLEVVSNKLTSCLFKLEIREKSRLILKERFLLHFHTALCTHEGFKVKNLNVENFQKREKVVDVSSCGWPSTATCL